MTTLLSGSVVGDEARETYVDQDGYIIDSETASVVGLDGFAENYRIDSDDAANAVLKRYAEAEAWLLSLEAQRKAINKNFDRLIGDGPRKRLSWLDWKYRANLIEWARQKIVGQKKRTAQFVYGKIPFRKGQESHRITDMEAAVQWAEDWGYEKIQIKKTIGIEDVEEIQRRIVGSMGASDPTPWFVTEPAEESVKIETGINTSKGEE